MTASAKISCRNLWKIFGHDAERFMGRHNGKPTDDDFAGSGLVGAVRDVSFDVFNGEILVIMGLSGSGKSTLIRTMTRLNEATAGQVLIDGEDVLSASSEALIALRRYKMGMVFQHFGLLPHRTVLENVAFPLEIRGEGRTEREARAYEMLKLVGLEGREHRVPSELSGGQQQRVGIARSLAVGPEIWFLDEPFSALDPLIRREMQDEFIRLQKLLKKTIVFITHDFDEAIRLADRIGIMKDGRLVQLATPEQMVSAPADDYVRAFTRNAPRDKILTLGMIAAPAAPNSSARSMPHDILIGDAAPAILSSDTDFNIVGADGSIIGTVGRTAMIAALYPEAAA